MIFDEYVRSLPGKLSEVKRLILKTLWEAGDTFPKDWVRSSTLLELTRQKYFDRRTRELRDEMGCDIETEHHHGEHCYRLARPELKKYNPRLYLTAIQKKQLFKRARYRCKVCGKKVLPGIQGLQADHKIPLIRGGSHEERNWQAICNECNIGKRGACIDCKNDCKQCPWAFPERTGLITLVRLPQSLAQKIRNIGITDQQGMEKIIIQAVDAFLSKH